MDDAAVNMSLSQRLKRTTRSNPNRIEEDEAEQLKEAIELSKRTTLKEEEDADLLKALEMSKRECSAFEGFAVPGPDSEYVSDDSGPETLTVQNFLPQGSPPLFAGDEDFHIDFQSKAQQTAPISTIGAPRSPDSSGMTAWVTLRKAENLKMQAGVSSLVASGAGFESKSGESLEEEVDRMCQSYDNLYNFVRSRRVLNRRATQWVTYKEGEVLGSKKRNLMQGELCQWLAKVHPNPISQETSAFLANRRKQKALGLFGKSTSSCFTVISSSSSGGHFAGDAAPTPTSQMLLQNVIPKVGLTGKVEDNRDQGLLGCARGFSVNRTTRSIGRGVSDMSQGFGRTAGFSGTRSGFSSATAASNNTKDQDFFEQNTNVYEEMGEEGGVTIDAFELSDLDDPDFEEVGSKKKAARARSTAANATAAKNKAAAAAVKRQTKFLDSMNCNCLRWAFRLNTWQPTREEWTKVLESLQLEEVRRVNQFHFRDDAKSAAIGRLMLRHAVAERLRLPWQEIRFSRNDKGKPYLSEPANVEDFALNVSHQGDFVLLASCSGKFCGVDVMKIEYPRASKSVDEYLTLMKRQFSDREFSTFQRFSEGRQKLALFYRYWCLKESYIKALGVGIHRNLSHLDFDISNNFDIRPNEICTNTVLNVIDEPADGFKWKFEESWIDDDHLAAVCTQDIRAGTIASCESHVNSGIPFRRIEISELLRFSQPLHSISSDEYENFCRKGQKS